MRASRFTIRAISAPLICLFGAGAGFVAAGAIAAPSSLASGKVGAKTIKGGPVTLTVCSPTSTSTDTTDTTDTTGTTRIGSCTTTPTRTTPTPISTPAGSDAPPTAAPASKALAALQKKLNNDINGQGGKNSALVVDETTDQTLWDYNGSVARLPASAEKIYTTSAALLDFGADATFRTRVLGTGKLLPDGTWDGTLYLRGGGDPTFGSMTFDKTMFGGVGATVQTLAANLKLFGIKRVDGRIVADASWFDSHRGGPDTHYHQNLETEGSLSGLSYDEGFTNQWEERLQHNPPLVAAQAFAKALGGAHVKGLKHVQITTGLTPTNAQLLASVSSPPLSTLLAMTNAPSNNFFAETLLKDLGAQYGDGGTTPDGAAAVRSVIAAKFNLHPRLNDGSGLSRYDRTSPEQVVYLLREMQSDPSFWNSLAVAGVSGTMSGEMLHSRAVGNCRGKTGTLHDVANLVGYCTARNGDQLVFAFMMNRLASSDEGHLLEDRAGVALANYKG